MKPSAAYQAGDAQEWVSQDGRYLIRCVRAAYGVKVRKHWQALLLMPLPGAKNQLLSLHRKRTAAEAACQRHQRGNA